MIINTKVEANPGQVFKPDDFDENIGKKIPLHTDFEPFTIMATITATSVAEDGSHAWLTMDAPGVASDTVDIGPMILSADEGPGYWGYSEEGL